MSGMKKIYTAGPVLWNGVEFLADGKPWVYFHAIDPVWIYHADSLNLPWIWILYKRTFDATNQLVTGIISTKCNLHHG